MSGNGFILSSGTSLYCRILNGETSFCYTFLNGETSLWCLFLNSGTAFCSRFFPSNTSQCCQNCLTRNVLLLFDFPFIHMLFQVMFPHQKRPEVGVFSHTSRLFVDDIETRTRLCVPDFPARYVLSLLICFDATRLIFIT